MRKCVSVIVVLVLIPVGVALGQTRPTVEKAMEQFRKLTLGPQCTKFDDTAYGPNAVTAYEGVTYRCAYVYDEWMTRTSRVAWVRVAP